MNGDLDNVTASIHRCRQDPDFVDTFYEIFLSTSAEVADKFANTDFKVQKLMLRESLLTMLYFNLGIEGTKEELVRLAKRHDQLDIKPEYYPVWLDSLCQAVHRHDPKYTAELENLLVSPENIRHLSMDAECCSFQSFAIRTAGE